MFMLSDIKEILNSLGISVVSKIEKNVDKYVEGAFIGNINMTVLHLSDGSTVTVLEDNSVIVRTNKVYTKLSSEIDNEANEITLNMSRCDLLPNEYFRKILLALLG